MLVSLIRPATSGCALLMAALSGCAQPTGPEKLAAAPTSEVRRTPFALADGFNVVRLQAATWFGCTAIRRAIATDGELDGAHIGLIRLDTGVEMLALGGIEPGASLGQRREVPVRVDVAGQSDTGTGWLENQYFNVFTSAEQIPALLRGASATLRFDGGFTVGRRFSPAVVRDLSRCYAEALAMAGLEPAMPGERLPVARRLPAPPAAGGLTPDIDWIRLE